MAATDCHPFFDGSTLDESTFWNIIETGVRALNGDPDSAVANIRSQLVRLQPPAIESFQQLLNAKLNLAYSSNLWVQRISSTAAVPTMDSSISAVGLSHAVGRFSMTRSQTPIHSPMLLIQTRATRSMNANHFFTFRAKRMKRLREGRWRLAGVGRPPDPPASYGISMITLRPQDVCHACRQCTADRSVPARRRTSQCSGRVRVASIACPRYHVPWRVA